MENSRTPTNSSEEAALDHLEQYFDTAGDDETLTREAAVEERRLRRLLRAGSAASVTPGFMLTDCN